MISQFVDTSYLIAVEVADDQMHEVASGHWRDWLETQSTKLVTSSYVLVEVVAYLNNHRRHSKAVELGNNLLSSKSINLIHVDEALLLEGWRYFEKHSDKTYSLTDCISFVLMTRLGIVEALTFDKHFAQAGFVKLP